MRSRPRVSVVIPVRNAARSIVACLDSVLSQDYEGDIEVVVADGASTDATPELLAAKAGADPRVLIVANPAGTTSAGLNAALDASTGEVVARCDAHAVLPPGYLRRAESLLAQTGAAVVGGIQRAVGETSMERAVALAMTARFGVGDAKFHYGGEPGPTDTVYLGVFRREIFEVVGRYDETLLRNQDYELNWRIRQAGEAVYFHPDLEVAYRPRGSVGDLWRQYFDYGRWKRVVVARNPRSVRLRQLAAPLLVVGLAGSVALAFTPFRFWASIVPAVYAASVAVASAATTLRRRDRAGLLLPVVFPTMHVGWGAGFLLGRIRSPRETPERGNSPSGPA